MYNIIDQQIPQNKREEINNKIISLINSGSNAISNEIIFNAYTGIGGLHHLKFNDFNSYSEFSDAKKEIENGQFFTPHAISRAIVQLLNIENTELVADLCFGMGNFINWLPNELNFFGCELDQNAYQVAKHLYPKANLSNDNIIYYNCPYLMDVIIGNPPFNLRWNINGDNITSQHYFMQKSAQSLKRGGILAVIVPSSYLSDELYDKSAINEINEEFNFVFQTKLDAKAFSYTGVSNFETKLMVFQRKSQHLQSNEYRVNEYQEFNLPLLKSKYIIPLRQNLISIKSNLFLEQSSNHSNNRFSFKNQFFNNNSQTLIFGLNKTKILSCIDPDSAFDFQIKKYLFEFKTHKFLNHLYAQATSLLHQLENQKRPEKISDKEWDESKLSKDKLLSLFKQWIKNQNNIELDTIRMVKTNYTIKLKAYSQSKKEYLNSLSIKTYYPLYEIINGSSKLSFDGIEYESKENYSKLLARKTNHYLIHNTPILEQPVYENISSYLSDFTFYGRNRVLSNFDKLQRSDLNSVLSRSYSLLNWQMGTGKTPSGYAFGCYNMFFKHSVKNVFVVSGATAISTTWTDWMLKHNQPHYIVNSKTRRKDIFTIPNGYWILISSDYLKKFKNELKLFVRINNQKVTLIFDESDELTNYHSQITQATLAVFRKSKYKLLTTGTTTRNNAGEIYGQLELLYNNSYLMLSECKTIYKETFIPVKDVLYKETAGTQIRSYPNKYFMQPFPALKGFQLFKHCFNPTKKSVLGIEKNNQDLYNVDDLNNILDKTVIVRTFKEMAGNKFKINQVTVQQSQPESLVYKNILRENQRVISQFFDSTGNSRKDAALRIIRLINLLIKATSTPQVFPDYRSSQTPTKTNKIIQMLSEFDKEQVAIGCTTHQAIDSYFKHITENFPMRQIFIITGKETQHIRKKRLAAFQSSINGILLSTQQSLKNSVNIPSCNQVIVESLQWNIPKIEQWYFRFIRRDQTGFTNVYFITYEQTIENNLLALLMSKEAINEMIKHREYKRNTDIIKDYDLDENIFASALSKAYDADGNLYLTWGTQSVA